MKQLQEDVMTIKVREANCQSDLKDTKQKYMELETQNHICTNQIRRMDEENKLLKTQCEESLEREKKFDSRIKEYIRKIDDMQSQVRYIFSISEVRQDLMLFSHRIKRLSNQIL